MRWATCQPNGDGDIRVGRVVGDDVYLLAAGVTLHDLLGDDGERLERAGDQVIASPERVIGLADARLLPPIPRPPTVRDFYAFERHVRVGAERRGSRISPEWYQLPVFYFTNPYALVGHGEQVALPPGCRALDFELEVAAIVGRTGSNMSPEEADRHIVGFSVLNDWSARDLQAREMSVGLGPAKGKDFATTLGPFLVTRDEVEPYRKANAYDLAMTARVNGRAYSRASLAEIYWSFGEMLAYASRGTRIEPGDVVGSGTCGSGCILELSYTHGADAFPWLKPGDEVELSVEHLGTLTNRVVEGMPLRPIRQN